MLFDFGMIERTTLMRKDFIKQCLATFKLHVRVRGHPYTTWSDARGERGFMK